VSKSLPGQETLLACWSALATTSPGAALVRRPSVVAAVFPSWAPLNNAILLDAGAGPAAAVAEAAVAEVAVAYAGEWAFWVPSGATSLDAPDSVGALRGLARDTTTLVMHAEIAPSLRARAFVVPASIAAATVAGDEPVCAADLGEPETAPGLAGWVAIEGSVAVAGAWTYLHGTDCGIYAVGTVPSYRRRGLARGLMEHVMAEAYRLGARTASLQSTRMGQPLYESLGFRAVGRYEEWLGGQPV
jgi:GNAT superfamily N-acetyltransferase